MDKIIIRKMAHKDLKALYRIGRRFWKDSWLTLDYLKDSFRQEGMSYSAKTNDRVIGGIIMVSEDIVKNWIRYFVIAERYQRMGIGSKLLQRVTKRLKHGENIFVDTGLTEKSALEFYEKNSFKIRGKVNKLYDNFPAYILEKTIK